MSGIAVAIGGSALLGAAASSKQSKAAGQASDADIAFRRQMWEAQQAQQEPWMEAGRNALTQISGMGGQIPVDLEQDPGYQFRMEQGGKMLERQLAGMGGGAYSGRGMKEAQRFGQQLGSQEYGAAYGRGSDAYNRLASLAGMGQTSASNLGQMGAQATPGMAGAISGGIMGPAQAQSSMYAGLGNLGMQGANLYQQQNYLNQMATMPTAQQYGTIPGSQQTNMLAAQW
jgi:hypothetical protein